MFASNLVHSTTTDHTVILARQETMKYILACVTLHFDPIEKKH